MQGMVWRLTVLAKTMHFLFNLGRVSKVAKYGWKVSLTAITCFPQPVRLALVISG